MRASVSDTFISFRFMRKIYVLFSSQSRNKNNEMFLGHKSETDPWKWYKCVAIFILALVSRLSKY